VLSSHPQPNRRDLSAFAGHLFDVLARRVQVPFAGVELTGCSEVGDPPVGLRLPRGQLLWRP
jgi:hypothetical protein